MSLNFRNIWFRGKISTRFIAYKVNPMVELRLAFLSLLLIIISFTPAYSSSSQSMNDVLSKSSADESKIDDWVERNKVLHPDFPTPDIPVPSIARLDRILEGKRVVFLGEPDHYISEKYSFRLMMIRHLVKRGFRHIGMEIGRSDGARINRFLQTGDERYLDQVGRYGYSGAKRHDRADKCVGMYEGVLEGNTSSFLAFQKILFTQEKNFARALLKIKKEMGIGLTFFGYDMDAFPGIGYEEVRSQLQPFTSIPLINTLQQKLAIIPNESMDQEALRVRQAYTFFREQRNVFTRILGPESTNMLDQALKMLADSWECMSVLCQNPTLQQALATAAKRESEIMFGQIDEALRAYPPTEGIILMGHNMHLSKKSSLLNLGHVPGMPMWDSIGSYVSRLLPGQIASFWMLFEKGTHWKPKCPTVSCTVESKMDTIEYVLGRHGAAFLLPMDGTDIPQELRGTLRFTANGDYVSGVLADQVDAIFFVREVHVTGHKF